MQRQIIWLIGLSALLSPILFLVAELAHQDAIRQLQASEVGQLDRFVTNLRSELDKYSFLPKLVEKNRRIVDLLEHPDDPLRVAGTNRYLERVNNTAGASATYLMDASGTTLAASNWNSERPFVGLNFRFRPYFQSAMRGEVGRYFALGTTSRVRGYYYAQPVTADQRILGAVVVKVSLEKVETAWESAANRIIVTDYEGVIFITNHAAWRLRTLRPLDKDVLEKIRASRQYGDTDLSPLDILDEQSSGVDAKLLTVRERAEDPQLGGSRRMTYLVQANLLPELKWIVHLLSDTRPVRTQVVVAVSIAGMLFVLLVLAVFFFRLWRRNHRLEAKHRKQVEDTLRQARDQLEGKVRERTLDLTNTNLRLDQEIAEHKQAENELRQAQAELIQAAKLAALGQLAAGVAHELNQPLAAIRAYSENAATFVQRNRLTKANENLVLIGELTERMAKITGTLKSFARKSDQQLKDVSVGSVLDNSLALLEARIHDERVVIDRKETAPPSFVRADSVRLEQVMVNLIKNALDAMADTGEKILTIDTRQYSGRVCIVVGDCGTGIPDDRFDRLFDPFFTTKAVGEGLGLGLSISLGIVKDFGGNLWARNRAEGGAEFLLELPLSETSVAMIG